MIVRRTVIDVRSWVDVYMFPWTQSSTSGLFGGYSADVGRHAVGSYKESHVSRPIESDAVITAKQRWEVIFHGHSRVLRSIKQYEVRVVF